MAGVNSYKQAEEPTLELRRKLRRILALTEKKYFMDSLLIIEYF